jgi:hypothetical protein
MVFTKRPKRRGGGPGCARGLGSEYGNKLVLILGHTSHMEYRVNGGHLARDTSINRVD